MKLLQEVKAQEQSDLIDARAEYSRLLEEDEPKSIGRLRQLMRSLGKSAAQAEADQLVIRRVAGMERQLTEANDIDVCVKREEAITQLEAYDAETAAILAERERGHQELHAIRWQTQADYDRASGVASTLREIILGNRQLFPRREIITLKGD